MDISIITRLPARAPNSLLLAPVYQNGKLSRTASLLNEQSDGQLAKVVKTGDLSGKPGSSLLIHQLAGSPFDRVLLVGAGDKTKTLDDGQYRKMLQSVAGVTSSTRAATIISALSEIDCTASDGDGEPRGTRWKTRQQALAISNSSYRFTEFKTDRGRKPKPQPTPKKLQILQTDSDSRSDARKGAKDGAAIHLGTSIARDLGNLPGNVCTPTYLAEQARQFKTLSDKVKVTVLSEKQMATKGMNSLLSVSRGSKEPACLISIEYRGAAASSKPVVLVGKGITFDTGGISLKPGAAMDEMKFDMCGAASVLGTMRAVIEMGLKCNVVCVVAAAENMPDGDASRPGDIVRTMSGQSVEILNTDAEGRLVLCDALTWVSQNWKPAAVIDVATLTGACIIALGRVCSAVMTNDQSLADSLISAGNESGDRTWQLPLWDDYQGLLKSNFADIANIGGRDAGTITAGCFLSRFTESMRWAHLDIAGIAWKSGAAKGATGRPVPLLSQYLMNHCKA